MDFRIDERGVTRQTVFRTTHIGWDDIRDYRLTIELRGQAPGALYLHTELSELFYLADVVRGVAGKSRALLSVELVGDGDRSVEVSGANEQVAEIIQRLREPFVARARDELAKTRRVAFGPLQLADHGVQWDDHDPLPREQVESIELFDASPVELRVMARGKVFPYGHDRTAKIPNLGGALEIATLLGYRVRGLEVFDAFKR